MSYGSLTLHLPNGETAVVDLTVSEIVLGRSRQATVQLDDDLMSKQHLRFTVKPDGAWLEDLGATNGTFVDGNQIPAHQPVQIQPGQSVQLGDTVFQYAPLPIPLTSSANAVDFEMPPAAIFQKKTAWRNPPVIIVAVLMLLLLCGIIGFSAWWFMGGRQAGNEGMPANGIPIPGIVSLEACAELPMAVTSTMLNAGSSPEQAAYHLLPIFDLPFAYGEGVVDFRQAMQRTQTGGRVSGFFDHLYPLYPSRPSPFGLEPTEAPIGDHTLLFSGQLNKTDNYSGHPGYDFAPEDSRQATTAVLAAAEGIISEVGKDESGAYFVKLVHLVPDVGSFQTIYWHLEPDSFFADTQTKVGEVIMTGTRLGTMGNSGWGAGIQLHFEVRFDGDRNGRFTLDEAIDPFAYLPSPAYPQSPWSETVTFVNGRGEEQQHAGQPSRYLWQYANGVLAQVGENGGGLIAGQGDMGLNPTSLCAPADSLPAGGTVSLAWMPDPVDVPERIGVGLSCTLSVADAEGEQLTRFTQPVRLEIPLETAVLSQIRPETLTIYWLEDGKDEWQALPTFIDETKAIAAIDIDRPGACALLGEPVADIIPPVSTIAVTGATGADDAFYEAVTVAISSEDKISIEYSLDAGTTWQPYTSPFTLAADGEPLPPRNEPVEDFGSGPGRFLVLAAASDAAGNRENPPAARLVVINPAKNPANAGAAESTPTPPETETECEPEITVAAQFGVNVRQGPGLAYNIVTTLPKDAVAPIIGRNTTGSWWRLDLDTGVRSEYWVADDVVDTICTADVPTVATPVPPTATPTDTPTATPTNTPTVTPTPTFTPTPTPTGDPDRVPPVVSINHVPATPDETETVAFTAQASDLGMVARIEIWVQAPGESALVRRKVCEDVTVCVYQGGSYVPGGGTYQAYAWDVADNQGETAVIPFTVLSTSYP